MGKHFTNQPKPTHLIEKTLSFDNDTWRIIGVGATDADGWTFLHLASTTRFREQRNGFIPVQKAEWINLALFGEAA